MAKLQSCGNNLTLGVGPNAPTPIPFFYECKPRLTHLFHPKIMKSLRNRDKMKEDAIAQLSD